MACGLNLFAASSMLPILLFDKGITAVSLLLAWLLALLCDNRPGCGGVEVCAHCEQAPDMSLSHVLHDSRAMASCCCHDMTLTFARLHFRASVTAFRMM